MPPAVSETKRQRSSSSPCHGLFLDDLLESIAPTPASSRRLYWLLPDVYMKQPNTTEHRILAAAKDFIQTRGYNGFSFHDISQEVGIRTPSVHHHFRTKSDLGRALLAQERLAMSNSMRVIDAQAGSTWAKLKRYVELWSDAASDGTRIGVLGMLAAEYNTLPEPMRKELREFFEENEGWLAALLRQGRVDRILTFDGAPAVAADGMLAFLHGAMVSARAFHDVERFRATVQWLLNLLSLQKRDRTRAEGLEPASR
jgi:TetR/AcrR family transcriptional repressor of nem operon